MERNMKKGKKKVRTQIDGIKLDLSFRTYQMDPSP